MTLVNTFKKVCIYIYYINYVVICFTIFIKCSISYWLHRQETGSHQLALTVSMLSKLYIYICEVWKEHFKIQMKTWAQLSNLYNKRISRWVSVNFLLNHEVCIDAFSQNTGLCKCSTFHTHYTQLFLVFSTENSASK